MSEDPSPSQPLHMKVRDASAAGIGGSVVVMRVLVMVLLLA